MKLLIGSFGKIVSLLISKLPRRLQLAMGAAIGTLWFDVFRIRRKIAIDNVARAYPEKPRTEHVRIARASLTSMGQTLIEFFLFPFLKAETIAKDFDVQGEEKMRAALSGGKGAIMLTLHVGNGDYALAALSRLGFPITLISKEFKAAWLNELWFGMRRKHGTKFIAPEKSSFEILRSLRRNEVVVFVLDQFMGPPVGVRTKFFGHVTGTAMGCALMADRTKAPVIPAYTYRGPDGRTMIVFEDAIPYLSEPDKGPEIPIEKSARDENIARMTQVYTDKIESIVRRHPEQWMWIHRRWKEFRD